MVFSKNVAELHHKLKKYSSKSYFSIKKSDTLAACPWNHTNRLLMRLPERGFQQAQQ